MAIDTRFCVRFETQERRRGENNKVKFGDPKKGRKSRDRFRKRRTIKEN